MTIGRRIRAAREAADMSQADLARLVGVLPSQISRWETREEPRAETVGTIASTLGVTCDALILGEMMLPTVTMDVRFGDMRTVVQARIANRPGELRMALLDMAARAHDGLAETFAEGG